MNTMKRTFFALSATALLAVPSYALAQDPPPPAQERPAAQAAPRAASVQGELVKVDDAAKTISIKAADGKEMQFTYNEQTEVAGARDGVAGLATKAGSKVTVQFTEKDGAKIATRIEVAP